MEGVECEGKGLTCNLGTAEDGRAGTLQGNSDSGTLQGKTPTAARWTLEGIYAPVFFCSASHLMSSFLKQGFCLEAFL